MNALCERACFRSERGRDRRRAITAEDILEAQEQLILERVLHLDQLADKLREERVRRVIEPLLSGAPERHYSGRVLEYVRDLGVVARDSPPRMASPICAEVVPRELTHVTQEDLQEETAWSVDPQGGRIEREYGLGRTHTDLLVKWPQGGAEQQYVVECKLVRGSLDPTVRKGLEQTAGYMDRCGTREGHLVVFDRSDRPWADRIFRRSETAGGRTVQGWGM